MLASEDVRLFRSLCRALGTSGLSERQKQRRQQALGRLKVLPSEPQRALFAATWRQEEVRRRKRLRVKDRFDFWGALAQIVLVVGIYAWAVLTKAKDSQVFVVLPWVLYANVSWFLSSWSGYPSKVQRGMARFLLQQEVTQSDIGRLIEISQFYPGNKQEHAEMTLAAWRYLTFWLPTLANADSVLLDAYHRKALRRVVVRVAQEMTRKNRPVLDAATTDYAAAALIALRAADGWRGECRDARKDRAVLRKLTDAALPADEPLNHRYVRDLARESVVQMGSTL